MPFLNTVNGFLCLLVEFCIENLIIDRFYLTLVVPQPVTVKVSPNNQSFWVLKEIEEAYSFIWIFPVNYKLIIIINNECSYQSKRLTVIMQTSKSIVTASYFSCIFKDSMFINCSCPSESSSTLWSPTTILVFSIPIPSQQCAAVTT